MSCHVEQVEFAGHLSTLIWCGEDAPPQPCATCNAPDAEYLCDWPELKRVSVPVEELKVGDVWVTEKNGKHGRVRAIEILGKWRYRFWVAIPGHKEAYPYERMNVRTAETLRPGTCDAPCCEAHAREVADEVHYCAAHWGAWESVT